MRSHGGEGDRFTSVTCGDQELGDGFPFRLRWTYDEWRQARDRNSAPIGTGHEYADIPVSMEQRAPVRFAFFWITEGWREGRDFQVGVNEAGKGRPLL